MFTLKQLEAFHFVAHLGGLGKAARRLNSTESALSKRLQELEVALGAELFDRSARALGLTAVGRRILPLADQLLHQRSDLLAAARTGPDAPAVLRIGMTELIAASFLATLVERLRNDHPEASIHPSIGLSGDMIRSLGEGDLDFVIAPRNGGIPSFLRSEPLFSSHSVWVCSPTFKLPAELTIEALAAMPIIMQPSPSTLHKGVLRWFQDRECEISTIVACNNLHGLKDLAVAGIGVAPLALHYCAPEISSGHLVRVMESDELPTMDYAVIYPTSLTTPLRDRVLSSLREVCFI